jgi:hypothetical protein
MDEKPDYDGKPTENANIVVGEVLDNADQLQRHLGNRQIQLIAIGGSIGTAVFVSINSGLYHGGPGSLFLAYTIYSIMLGLVNNCAAEMISVRLSDLNVDLTFLTIVLVYACIWGFRSSFGKMGRRSFWFYGRLEFLPLRGSYHSIRDHRFMHRPYVLAG